MRIPFCELTIDLDITGIIRITAFELKEGLNTHSLLEMECQLDEDSREQAVARASRESRVRVSQGEEILFAGILHQIQAVREKGKWELSLQYISGTYEMDWKKRSRVFYRQGDCYQDVIGKVAALYPQIQVRDEITKGAASPGTLLQYEETDWQFLKRLASHFSSFLVPDTASWQSRFYFGLPSIDRGQSLWDLDYTLLQDVDRYNRFGTGMEQEYTSWRVRSHLALRLGECIRLNGTEAVVTELHYFFAKGEILREYTVSRPEGLVIRPEFNYEILGISLPVTVTNRKDNLVQVEFDVNQPYPSEEPSLFFTYGIESSSFYCMPEVGSRAHIYFPNRQDWKAIAVHALNLGSGSERNPDCKTFSSPTGAALMLTPSSYSFQSDSGGASTMHMGTDGNLTLCGKNIAFQAGTSISVGEGKEATPKIELLSKGKQLYQVGNSDMALESNLTIIADKSNLNSESGDQSAAAQAIRDALTANDAALRDSYGSQGTWGGSGKSGNSGNPGSSGGSGFGGSGGSSQSSSQNKNSKLPFDITGGTYKYKPKRWDNKTPAGWLDDKKNEDNYKWPIYDNGNPDKIEKYRHTISPIGISDSGNAFGKVTDKPNVKVTPGAWKYQASAFAGMTEENHKFGVGIQGSASFAMAEIQFKEGKLGSEDYNIHAGGDVAILKAEAKADAVIGYNKDGKFQLGVAGELGFYKVDASAKFGATVAGVGVNAKVSGRIGFGFEGQFGLVDGKITAKLGACFLFGGSVEFEIDVSKYIPWL